MVKQQGGQDAIQAAIERVKAQKQQIQPDAKPVKPVDLPPPLPVQKPNRKQPVRQVHQSRITVK